MAINYVAKPPYEYEGKTSGIAINYSGEMYLDLKGNLGKLTPTGIIIVAPRLSNQRFIHSLANHSGDLYAGTGSSGLLFKWNGIDAWDAMTTQYGSETDIYSLAVYSGNLYAGTNGTALLLRYNGSGWDEVAGQYGSEAGIHYLHEYSGYLYGSTVYGGRLLRWNNTDSWELAADTAYSQSEIYSLEEYDGNLYGGTSPSGLLFKWNNSDAWEKVADRYEDTDDIHFLKEYNGDLFGCTINGTFDYLLKYVENSGWYPMSRPSALMFTSLVPMSGELYLAGERGWVWKHSTVSMSQSADSVIQNTPVTYSGTSNSYEPQYQWYFQDGVSASGNPYTHSYADIGTKTNRVLPFHPTWTQISGTWPRWVDIFGNAGELAEEKNFDAPYDTYYEIDFDTHGRVPTSGTPDWVRLNTYIYEDFSTLGHISNADPNWNANVTGNYSIGQHSITHPSGIQDYLVSSGLANWDIMYDSQPVSGNFEFEYTMSESRDPYYYTLGYLAIEDFNSGSHYGTVGVDISTPTWPAPKSIEYVFVGVGGTFTTAPYTIDPFDLPDEHKFKFGRSNNQIWAKWWHPTSGMWVDFVPHHGMTTYVPNDVRIILYTAGYFTGEKGIVEAKFQADEGLPYTGLFAGRLQNSYYNYDFTNNWDINLDNDPVYVSPRYSGEWQLNPSGVPVSGRFCLDAGIIPFNTDGLVGDTVSPYFQGNDGISITVHSHTTGSGLFKFICHPVNTRVVGPYTYPSGFVFRTYWKYQYGSLFDWYEEDNYIHQIDLDSNREPIRLLMGGGYVPAWDLPGEPERLFSNAQTYAEDSNYTGWVWFGGSQLPYDEIFDEREFDIYISGSMANIAWLNLQADGFGAYQAPQYEYFNDDSYMGYDWASDSLLIQSSVTSIPVSSGIRSLTPILTNMRNIPYRDNNDYLVCKLETLKRRRISYEKDLPCELWVNTSGWWKIADGTTNRYGMAFFRPSTNNIVDTVTNCLGVAKVTYKDRDFYSNPVRFNFV